MTNRENFFSLIHRKGFERIPYSFDMCESLARRFASWQRESGFEVDFTLQSLPGVPFVPIPKEKFLEYYQDRPLKAGAILDENGVGHEPGSEYAYHMTYMRHPMQALTTIEEILEYPIPDYSCPNLEGVKAAADKIRQADRISVANMACTVWETSWYMRGMNELMMDMLSDEDMAAAVLDKVTQRSVYLAEAYARCGADVLHVGDDVGMQKTIMMSETLYCRWLQPRLKRVIDAARAIKPDIVVLYHSCGYVLPLIDRLIEAGIDILDPVQPECMDFQEVHHRFGDRLSFKGTIGTQTTMPFGTPKQVRDMVFRNLDIAGKAGGLLVAPTHLLEPEVPVENIAAYVSACREYTGG